MAKTRASSKSGYDLDPLLPENLPTTIAKLKGAGVTMLRSLVNRRFGIRFQSTGDAPDSAQTRILMQTINATPSNPYVVEFHQFILDPFTGPGQFDLTERNADDIDVLDIEGELVSGGESQVTLATKTGFEDGTTTGGWSRFAKVITENKTYRVIFVPGDAGDGVFLIKAQELK